MHGIFHAGYQLGAPVQSFDSSTLVAPTSALNPAVIAEPDRLASSFQVQQTRLGLVVGEGTPVRGNLEIDFVHFDQASRTAQAFPRIRIMSLEYSWAENQRIFAGQNWDLFGNAQGPQMLCHGFNLVGTLFRAGNNGFMRHQAGYRGRFGPIEVSSAIGLPGSNNGPSLGTLEQSLVPTLSGRVLWFVGPKSSIDVSGLVTSLRFVPAGEASEYRTAFGAELFTDVELGPLNIHSEIHVAQNLANNGTLNLEFGRAGQDVTEIGGYVSAKWKWKHHALTAMVGGAIVTQEDAVLPSYTDGTASGAAFGTLNPSLGPGITRNASAHIGYWFYPYEGLSSVLEPQLHVTRFALLSEDEALGPNRIAASAMLGSMYSF